MHWSIPVPLAEVTWRIPLLERIMSWLQHPAGMLVNSEMVCWNTAFSLRVNWLLLLEFSLGTLKVVEMFYAGFGNVENVPL